MYKNTITGEQVLNCVAKKKPLTELAAISSINGRLDLRGIMLPRPAERPLIIKKYNFENIDFSAAGLNDIFFEKCVFSNCLFEKANLEKVHLRAVKIINCQFINANLGDSSIGNIGNDSGEIQCTIFHKTNFSHSFFSFPIIHETLFDDCRLHEVDFDSSRFSNTTFKGRISDSFFRGYSLLWEPGFKWLPAVKYKNFRNRMLNVDFSQCVLNGVSFTHGIDLSHCKFPAADNYFVVKDLATVYTKARQIITDTWINPERDLYLRMIDTLYYNKDRREQAMDLMELMPGNPDDKPFFDLIKRINTSL